MRRFLLFGSVAVLALELGCARLNVSETRGVRALARNVAAPQGYLAQKSPGFFDRDNLYKAIDGMANEYISYGCRALAMLEWHGARGTEEKMQAELYDMGSPLGAFGIYSRAHVGTGDFADVGEEAAVAEDAVEFARGQFYVRLMGPLDSRPVLETVAKTVVAQVPAGPRPEQLAASLPPEGRVARSERWIPEAAFGMEFMRNVWAARYKLGDKNVELYLASLADPTTASAALRRFRETVKDRSPQTAEGKLPGFIYSDDYLGRVGVFQIERQLAVIVGYEKRPEIEALLQNVAASTSSRMSAGLSGRRP